MPNNSIPQIQQWQRFKHPNLVQIEEITVTSEKVYVIKERVIAELFFLLQKEKRFQESVGKFWAFQLGEVLDYLKSNQLDLFVLDFENILIDSKGDLRFNLSVELFKVQSSFTIEYYGKTKSNQP